MKQITAWFKDLKQHEQILVLACAALVAAYLIYLLVWSPIASRRDELVLQNNAAQESLQNVRELAAQYLALSQNGNQPQASSANLSRIVDSSAAQNNLVLRRFQLSSNGEASVRFENVAFNNVLTWVNELEYQHGVLIRELQVSAGNGSGLVNVSVRVQKL